MNKAMRCAWLLLMLAWCAVTGVTAVLQQHRRQQNMMTNAKKKPLIDDTKCPHVKPMRHFNINKYYASSEEELSYDCMRATLEVLVERSGLEVHMNFSYAYLGDPEHHLLLGNITWVLPDMRQSAHWQHAEVTSSPRYLSSLLMRRSTEQPLGVNVLSYLRDKLQRYGVSLEYLFPMPQQSCPQPHQAKTVRPALTHPFSH
ncbi:hypothetical protein B566_EDAN009291 [Ephemera danica]|nr:hypothetical protein B566_EDAN009291 [Ephemera danica]